MPQTTDQLHAAILNLPWKAPSDCMTPTERMGYDAGHRDARHAAAELVSAVPLVAEAPREPTGEMRWAGAEAAKAQLQWKPYEMNWQKAVGEIYKAMLAAAPSASLAPMPEETQRCLACGDGEWTLRFTGKVFVKTCNHCKGDYGDDEVCRLNLMIRPYLSHLRTAPRPTLSDEQARNEALALSYVLTAWKNVTSQEWDAEHQLLRKVLADASRVLALLASVAPQPEQPNTDSVHLADNGRTPVQGLDAADGVVASAPGFALRWNDRFMEVLSAIHGPVDPGVNDSARLAFAQTLSELVRGTSGVPAVFCLHGYEHHDWRAEGSGFVCKRCSATRGVGGIDDQTDRAAMTSTTEKE